MPLQCIRTNQDLVMFPAPTNKKKAGVLAPSSFFIKCDFLQIPFCQFLVRQFKASLLGSRILRVQSYRFRQYQGLRVGRSLELFPFRVRLNNWWVKMTGLIARYEAGSQVFLRIKNFKSLRQVASYAI